jgi:hypothetical protein
MFLCRLTMGRRLALRLSLRHSPGLCTGQSLRYWGIIPPTCTPLYLLLVLRDC